MAIATRLSNNNGSILTDEFLYQTDQSTIDQQNGLQSEIIGCSVIVAFFAIVFLSMFSQYRQIKRRELQGQNSGKMNVVNKLLAITFGCFNEIIAIAAQFIFAISYYKVTNIPQGGFSTNQIILLSVASIGQFLLVLLIVIEKLFLNIQFKNSFLLQSRLTSGYYDFIQPTFSVLTIFFAVKPNLMYNQQVIFQLVIIFLSLLRLAKSTFMGHFYDERMHRVDIVCKSISSSFYCAQFLVFILGNSNTSQISLELVLAWILLFLTILGASIISQKYRTNQVIQRFCQGIKNMDAVHDQQTVEYGVYLLYNSLDSLTPMLQLRFQSLVFNNDDQQELQYYSAITDILYENDVRDTENQAVVDDMTLRTLQPQMNPGNESGKNAQYASLQLQEFSSQIEGVNESKSLSNFGSLNQKQISKVISQVNSNQYKSDAEVTNHLLKDVFQYGLLQRGNVDYSKKKTMSADLIGKNISMNALGQSEEEAIRLVKVRFLFDKIARICSKHFSQSLRLLFFNAMLAIDRLQNKYLTLTTITHINLQSQRKQGYLSQIQTKISQFYFVDLCLNVSNTQQNQKYQSKDENQSEWVENDKIIDSNLLLEQSLYVDRILTKVRICAENIGHFWQLYQSPHLGIRDLQTFLNLTITITEMLQEIKIYSYKVENPNSEYLAKSDQLCFALSQFYGIVLRNQAQGLKMTSCIEAFHPLNSLITNKGSSTDEIGVIVVDGNFDLYGRIIFGNKLILKILGYRGDDLINKTVHSIMPSAVGDIHNKFWKGFSELGEPKVLDSVRFLFAKDSRGYVSPVKLLIKFQYNVQYGYSFIGLFKPQKDAFISNNEIRTSLSETYQMICSTSGKILNISESCKNLLGITPTILEMLHDQLAENLLISSFNPMALSFSSFDFQNNSCMNFKSIILDLGWIIGQIDHIKSEFQSEEEMHQQDLLNEKNKSKRSQLIQAGYKLRVQMKIIKEEYGVGSIDEPLTLYYVFFSEATSQVNQQLESGLKIGGDAVPLSTMNDILALRENLHDIQEEFERKMSMDSQGKVVVSGSINSGIQQASMSSASTNTASQIEIKSITENTDTSKIPKMLTLLRIAVKTLSFVMLLLSTVQFVLNQQNSINNLKDETVLIQSVQSQEYLTQLTLLTRSYLNIQLNIEPSFSNYTSNRGSLNKQIALDLIERLRLNMDNLNFYLVQNNYNDLSLSKNITGYTLLPDKIIEPQNMTKFNLINLWLVQVQEIYLQPTFESSIGTLLEPSIGISNFDQEAFFSTVNPDYGLGTMLNDLITQQSTMSANKIANCVYVNKVLTIISSIVTFIAVFSGVLVIINILMFKAKVLRFFEKLGNDQLTLQEHRSLLFQQFLQNSDMVKLQDSTQTVIEKMSKLTKSGLFNIAQYPQIKTATLREHDKNQEKSKILSGKNVNFESVSNGEEDDVQRVSSKLNVDSEEEQIEEEKENSSQSQRRKKKNKKTKEIKEQRDVQQTNQRQFQFVEAKEREVMRLLDRSRVQQITRLIPLSVLLVTILVTYFVVQFLLFQSQSTSIQTNSNSMIEMIGSMQCQEALIENIRSIQVSNNTQYVLTQTDPSIPLYLQTIQGDHNSFQSLNSTYLSCILQNQQAANWLQTIDNGQYNFANGANISVCSLYEGMPQNSSISLGDCLRINSGVLQSSPLATTSLFLQNAMYSAIQFLSPTNPRDAQSIETNFINNTNLIELIDAQNFIQQYALRYYYQQVINWVLGNQATSTIIGALFGAFIGAIIIGTSIIHWGVIWRIRKWIWNSYLLLQLLPLDDLEPEFIKSVNEFIQKA